MGAEPTASSLPRTRSTAELTRLTTTSWIWRLQPSRLAGRPPPTYLHAVAATCVKIIDGVYRAFHTDAFNLCTKLQPG